MANAKKTAKAVVNEAEENWGRFRLWIKANPLSGFWSGVGVGTVIVAPIGYGLARVLLF